MDAIKLRQRAYTPGTRAIIPGTAFNLTDDFTGTYGEVATQLDWVGRMSGWSTFVKADAKFNDKFTIFTGKGGIRYGF